MNLVSVCLLFCVFVLNQLWFRVLLYSLKWGRKHIKNWFRKVNCRVQSLILSKNNSTEVTQVLFPHIYNRHAIIVYLGVKKAATANTGLVPLTQALRRSRFYSVLLLYHQCKSQHNRKANDVSVLWWWWWWQQFWGFGDPEKILKDPGGPRSLLWEPLV